MKELDPLVLRKDFPMYQDHASLFEGKPLVYLDNAATTFKPYCVIEAEEGYYRNYTANTRRGDYSLAHQADVAYQKAREKVAAFLNAPSPEEVVFTSGDTFGLNQVAFGLLPQLSSGDEIVLSPSEHASNVLPWFRVAKLTGAIIKYVPLDEKGEVVPENLKKVLSSHTKVVALASVSNVMGYCVDVKSLASLAHSVGALYVDDGAQSVPHHKTDVQDSDVDFLVFSGHKMCGPTGSGALYGKKEQLEKLEPLCYGGEMNARFHSDGYVSYDDLPYRLEAGTQNVAGAIGLGRACEYLESIGFDAISTHERKLRDLAVKGLEENGNAVIYNPEADGGIVTFNIKDVFAQDVATYLSSKGVFVRSGQHCAKILPEVLKTQGTVRASFYLYNTEEDVKALIEACNTAEDFLDAYFA